MKIDTTIDETISSHVASYYREKAKEHTPSGRLSASILGWPLQWQVLKYLGVPQVPLDQYTMRKFLRGQHVEEFIAGFLEGERQVEVNYRDVVGYIDLLKDIPYEIKSVANSKYKWIQRQGGADPQHKLQAALYALAKGMAEYGIIYVASDDYRITTFIYPTLDSKEEIDHIVDQYNYAIEKHSVPSFKPRYGWQEKFEYNNYPEFMSASPERIAELLKFYKVSWR